MSINPQEFRETAEAVLAISPNPAVDLDDEGLKSALRVIATHRQSLDTYAVIVAGEIARRSRHELGYSGLAQRSGFRTPEAFVQSLTGTTRVEAISLVQVGTIIAETEAAVSLRDDPPLEVSSIDVEVPWQACLVEAITARELSVPAADAIRVGLGEVTENVTAGMLAGAAASLIHAASSSTVEQLRKLARQLRDELDSDGLVERERHQQEAQYLKTWKRADGMYGGSLLLDAENGAYLTSVIDEITNPRRGGPRFVHENDRARVEALIAGPRSNERIAVDSLIELVRIGAQADPGTVFGSRRPAVRVIVTTETLTDRDGHGVIEQSGATVSLPTVDRHICESGTVNVTINNDGQCLDVGREQRMFTKRQRTGLAVRDGGCRWPDCERPPSWTEAHHIDEWARDNGLTNIADGMLLCRLCRYRHNVDITTCCFTTTDGRFSAMARPTGYDHRQRKTPSRYFDRCRAKVLSCEPRNENRQVEQHRRTPPTD